MASHIIDTTLDLTQHEMLNAAEQTLAAPPATPVLGQIYFDTVLNLHRQWNGTRWVTYIEAIDTAIAAPNIVVGDNLQQVATKLLAYIDNQSPEFNMPWADLPTPLVDGDTFTAPSFQTGLVSIYQVPTGIAGAAKGAVWDAAEEARYVMLASETQGNYVGSAALYASLPTGADNGDLAILTTDVVGTGTASSPEHPAGIYILNAGVWTLAKRIPNGLMFNTRADGSTLVAQEYGCAEPAAAATVTFLPPPVVQDSWFGVANTGAGTITVGTDSITGPGTMLFKANATSTGWVNVSGNSQLEVGIGNALPADDSIHSLYRLQGHATLPNALFWFDRSITTWVMV